MSGLDHLLSTLFACADVSPFAHDLQRRQGNRLRPRRCPEPPRKRCESNANGDKEYRHEPDRLEDCNYSKWSEHSPTKLPAEIGIQKASNGRTNLFDVE